MWSVGLAAIIFVLFVLIWHWARQPCLNGLWEAPEAFCKESGLALMYLYIHVNDGYLLMANDNGIIYNAPISMQTSWGLWGSTGQISIEFEGDTIAPLPQKMDIWHNGLKIRMTSDDTAHAVLWRNPDYSD